MAADAAPHPHWQAGTGQLLEEDERLDLADPAPGLAAHDDQAGGAGLLRGGGLLDRGDLDHEPANAGPGGVGHGGQVGHGQHERVRGRRQRPAGEGPGRRGAHREAGRDATGDLGEPLGVARGAVEVEHGQRARPRHRHGKTRIGPPEGVGTDDDLQASRPTT